MCGIIWVKAQPTETGHKIGNKSFTIRDIYDINFLTDGTSSVLRCLKMIGDYPRRDFISLEEYDVTIGLSRNGRPIPEEG